MLNCTHLLHKIQCTKGILELKENIYCLSSYERRLILNKRIFIWGILLINLVFSTFFLSGCSNKPYLTGNNSYIIHTIKATGEVQNLSIVLPWNFNMAIMHNLLLESSFVLSDLRTLDADSIEPVKPTEDTILLESIFPESQKVTLVIDQNPVVLDINSVQIEVEGANIGRVILNQTFRFQGINDPNLQPAFRDFMKTLETNKENPENNS